MQSYQTSLGFPIWTMGLEGQDVFLYDDKAGGAFAVQNFDSLDEAHKIYDTLKQHPHPNFSKALPPFEVGKVALLAWKKEGKSIDDFTKLPGGNRKFAGDPRVSLFYQNIITDLILVVRHSMNTEIECNLNLSDVFISEDPSGQPHITLMKFKWRGGGCGSNAEWTKLGDFIHTINKCTNCRTGKEMEDLISIFKKPDKEKLARVESSVVFWSPSDCIMFINQLSDVIEASKETFSHSLSKEAKIWFEDVERNNILKSLKAHVDNHKKGDRRPRAPDASFLSKDDDAAAGRFIKFMSKSFTHFEEIKSTMHVFYSTENELLRVFENNCKDIMHCLCALGMKLEQWDAGKSSTLRKGIKILPRKQMLRDLS